MAKKEDTFIEISNNDIYNKLLDLEKKQEESTRINTSQHNDIITRQNMTNGKVKLVKWVGTTALSLTLILLGFFFNHLSN
jgi:hypothetical protein